VIIRPGRSSLAPVYIFGDLGENLYPNVHQKFSAHRFNHKLTVLAFNGMAG
jgi:hypothetical protein